MCFFHSGSQSSYDCGSVKGELYNYIKLNCKTWCLYDTVIASMYKGKQQIHNLIDCKHVL